MEWAWALVVEDDEFNEAHPKRTDRRFWGTEIQGQGH